VQGSVGIDESSVVKRLWITLALGALLLGALAAVGPLQDIWVGGRLHLQRAREAERAAHRPPHKEASVPNIEPEIFALLERASHPRVYRLGQLPGRHARQTVLGYPVKSEIPVDGERWVGEFVGAYFRMTRVDILDPKPLTPNLAVHLEVPGGSADILIGRRQGLLDSADGMLMSVRTKAGLRTIEAYSLGFVGWPDPPDSAIQKLRFAFRM
jgi:hypothetical protein